jgi:cysteinyl-tRNA synthetase
MGKSYGNFITLDELFNGTHAKLVQPYSPMTVRFFILQAHYRSTLDFSNEALQAAEKGLKKIMQAAKDVKNIAVTTSSEEVVKEVAQLKENVYTALCDDLNTPIALSHLFDAARIVNSVKDGKMAVGAAEKDTLVFLLTEILENVLGIVDEQGADSASNGNMSVIEGLMEMVLAERAEAKANKDWTKSDFIRDKLKEIGVQVKDTKNGVEWSI